MHTHSRRTWGLVAGILVVIAAHALLLYLFLEARLSAVLGGGVVIFLVLKYVIRKRYTWSSNRFRNTDVSISTDRTV